MKTTKKTTNKTAAKVTKSTKASKKAAKVQSPKQVREHLFDYAIGPVARRLGRLGWKAADAVKAIQKLVPNANTNTIAMAVYRGAKKLQPELEAKLNDAQLKQLKKAAA